MKAWTRIPEFRIHAVYRHIATGQCVCPADLATLYKRDDVLGRCRFQAELEDTFGKEDLAEVMLHWLHIQPDLAPVI